ncbi:MAG: winged helix-turn-helix transcriptional regulator [Lachnospiraceae bacterium]|jgi:DNA-binding MarR family transcriptional regulator|nr:winged helix-turn-helix transcriptional regulator [Lachnospiraceae bacterium]
MKACSSRDMKRFNHLLGEIEAVYHEMALKFGQSDSVMNILYTICDYGESCPLQEICRRSGISKQTINSALRKLEREGIVYSEQAGVKGKNVCLTEKGKELVGDTAVRVIEAENGILASWPEEDVKKYLELTERFLVGIKEKAKEINTGSL